MKKLISFCFCLLGIIFSNAQELNCNVSIDYSNIETQDKQIFSNMEGVFYEFLNNRNWTEDRFETIERIKCNLIIQLSRESDAAAGVFTGTAYLTSSRPVFGVDYETVVLSYVDENFTFNFKEGENVNFTLNSFSSNLASILGFYAYVVIGYDYDSYASLGGSKAFENAREVMNQAQNAMGTKDNGWGSLSKKSNNRFNLIDQIYNPRYEDVRKGMYRYHRHVLDKLSKPDPVYYDEVLKFLAEIEKVNSLTISSVYVTSFFLAKQKELINFFKGAPDVKKKEAFEILKRVDPKGLQKYMVLNN